MTKKSTTWAVATTMLLNACATVPDNGTGTAEKPENTNPIVALVVGLQAISSALSGQTLLPKDEWYKSYPDYNKVIAPYVLDEARFKVFMNKYKEHSPQNEQEALEVAIQLGINKYRPEWLKLGAKAKIDAMLKRASTPKKVGQESPAIRLAYAEVSDAATAYDFRNVGVHYVDASTSATVATTTTSLTPLISGGALAAGGVSAQVLFDDIIASIAIKTFALAGTAAVAIFTVAAIAKIKSDQDKACAQYGGCSTVTVDKPKEEIVVVGQGRKWPPCSPYPAGTIGYKRQDAGHDHHPAGDPHLHLLQVNQNPVTGKCFWNRPIPDVANPPPLPGWVDLTRGVPVLTP